jgi:DNA-binding HxlR family transcriptional regulator
MNGKRTYGDRCGIARALDLVGERWALLVVRELLLGPKRFTDLRAGLSHVGPDVLSQRLRDLEDQGIVRRAKLPPPAGARPVYELTDRGAALEPVILELGRWGSQIPFSDALADAELGVDSAVLALKTVFDPSAADGADETYELRLNGQPFRLRAGDGRLEAMRGSAERPAAVIATDPATLARVLWRGGRRSEFDVEGDKEAVKRFISLFPAPL